MRDILSVFRKVVVGVSLMGLAVATVPVAFAQQNSAVRGGLAGVVTDAAGAVIPNAKVTLVGPQATINLTTDGSGRYEATGLTPGLYTLTVTAPGFTTYVSKGNEVTIDHTQTLNAKLGIGEVGTTVTVEGGITAIDTENTSVNTAITDTFYNAMPLPRNVAGVFYVAPGVVSGGGTGVANPSIGGASGLENLYIADGVTITDQAYGGLGVYTPSHGSLGTGINLAFIKEVDIKTGAFEPKYGQADGGIVEIVTKSGSNTYHGSIAAYVTPQMGFANAKQLYQYNYILTSPSSLLSSPKYELSAEIGGYIPGFRDKLFFFGAFDPTLNRLYVAPNPTAGLAAIAPVGGYPYNTTSANWAAKVSYLPFSSTIVEASSYGDPSRNNSAPTTTAATNAPSVSSSYQFGTRNSIFRVNTNITPRITAFGAYSYNHAAFTEKPTLPGEPGYQDRNVSPFNNFGVGTYYTTKENTYQLQGEVSANASFFGKHTASIGYLYDHTDFNNSTLRSGPGYIIPSKNIAGTSLTSLYSNIPANAIGQLSNAQYRLITAPGCQYCPFTPATPGHPSAQVYFQSLRATYKGSVVAAVDRYHAAYGNEVFSPNRYVTINAGLRWEQQAYGGALLTYHWHDNWSPRLGVSVDPFGDRKSKVFFTYSRYQAPLPLDAAIRQLGSEADDTGLYFAPISVNGIATPDATGAFTPDTSVALNGTFKSATAKFGAPSFSSSTGEGILPGTKMEEQDEYILGISREVKPGMVLSARYTDRHYVRIVEDIGSECPECSAIEPNYAGGIANVSASSDFFVNETEVVYTPAQFVAANGVGSTPGTVTASTYKAPVAGCTFANDTSVANGGFYQHFDSTPYNGACLTNYLTAAALGADGIPDGFADPRRHYQAFEVEMIRALKNHWQGRINYRFGKLYGNYEGFFRNDNGQSDPGISSLFDFTQGAIGLLGDQFKRGYLNSDRRHVANVLLSYTVDKATPMLGKYGNGLSIGTWFHALSGTPISAFQSHPIYLNTGEVPVGGRGTIGTTPVAMQLDLHLEDSHRFHDKYTLRAAWDGFNVTNSQPLTGINQNLDTAPLTAGGVKSPDYNKPTAFQGPFSTRFKLAFEF
jgi:hypothetical protein